MSPASPPDDLDLDSALGERYYEGSKDLEEKYTAEIVEAIRGAIQGHFEKGGGLARRDAHAFDNGCVRAIFRVDEDLDPDLCQGLRAGARIPDVDTFFQRQFRASTRMVLRRARHGHQAHGRPRCKADGR